MCAKSRHDKLDPSLLIPYIDKLLPSLEYMRTLMELPIANMSKIETLLHKREIPYTETEDPTRAHARRERLLPNSIISRMDKLLPNFVMPYTDKLLPQRLNDLTERLLPRWQ
jgi:hypothetical protein